MSVYGEDYVQLQSSGIGAVMGERETQKFWKKVRPSP